MNQISPVYLKWCGSVKKNGVRLGMVYKMVHLQRRGLGEVRNPAVMLNHRKTAV
jgi:hypothetical protein